MIHYLTPGPNPLVQDYLDSWGREVAASTLRILSYEDLLARTFVNPGIHVFSVIDGMEPPFTRFVHELASKLRLEPDVRILNDPSRVLRRFDLHAALWKQGLNGFRSFRALGETTGMSYPVFIRAEESHDGALSPLLSSSDEVDAWLGRLIALGHRLADLLIVEFCETADQNGWYRKYAAFNVDGRIVARGLFHGRGWMLKAAGNESPLALAEEELEYVRTNPHEEELREIFRIARIDYGRIDYSFRAGKLQTWEINLNPTIGRGLRPSTRQLSTERRIVREKAKEIFYSRFNEAWRVLAATCPGSGGPAREIEIDPALLRPAKEAVRRRLVATAIRRLKPLIGEKAWSALWWVYRLPEQLVRSRGDWLFRSIGRRARLR